MMMMMTLMMMGMGTSGAEVTSRGVRCWRRGGGAPLEGSCGNELLVSEEDEGLLKEHRAAILRIHLRAGSPSHAAQHRYAPFLLLPLTTC